MKPLHLLLVIFAFTAPAQTPSLLKDSTVNLIVLQFGYKLQFPLADMNSRFGVNSAIGTGIGGKVGRNIFLGAEGNFLFGKKVQEDDLLDAITDDGYLIGSSGLYADYSFSERGFSLQAQGGKIISFKKPNVNSGLLLLLGAGFLQHKILIAVEEESIPLLLGKEYQKGYDRLTNGLLLSQFIGYFFLDSGKKRINWFAGLELQEGFTKNRRSWNYDEKRQDDSARKDILLSMKLGWMIPIYRTQTEKYYYY